MRTVVGVAASVQGAAYVAAAQGAVLTIWAIGLAAMVGGGSLLLGFLTPLAGGLAGFGLAVIAISSASGLASGLFLDRLDAVGIALVATAVVLIGPGSLSIDALLFGRREIVFPPHPQIRRR